MQKRISLSLAIADVKLKKPSNAFKNEQVEIAM